MGYYFVEQTDDGPLAHYAGSPGFDLRDSGSGFSLPADAELVGVDTYSVGPVVSSTGLKGILLDILGPYDNIVTQYEYRQNGNNYYSYVNEITPDYPWIASAALFIVLVISVFGVLKRSMSWLQ